MDELEGGFMLMAADSDSEGKFDISIDGRRYKVVYDKTALVPSGKIMDPSYDPALEVGIYYFSLDDANGGLFSYNHYGGDIGSVWRTSEYHQDHDGNTDAHLNYGILNWYSTLTCRQGKSYTCGGIPTFFSSMHTSPP